MTSRLRYSDCVGIALNVAYLAIVLAVAIHYEQPPEPKPPAINCGEQLLDRGDIEVSAAAYTRTVTSGYRNVRSSRVTVIPLSETTDPAKVLNNVCEQRWYLARLVPRLAAAGATAIVFDKSFGPDSCPEKDPGTLALIAAVQHSGVPVVVGVGTHVPSGSDLKLNSNPKNVCQIESGSLDFGNKLDANEKPELDANGKPELAVKVGLIRLNSDIRKIPLNWRSYRDVRDDAVFKSGDAVFRSGGDPTDTETLSWVAATLVDKDLGKDPVLLQLRNASQHPFTSFISDHEGLTTPSTPIFSHADALSFLCKSPAKEKEEIAKQYPEYPDAHCKNRPPPDEILGRVVVIGEDVSGRDRHTLLGDDVSGVYLQANYIESLLDGRYLRPLGARWDSAVLVVWVVVVYLVFWFQPRPLVALGLSLLVGFVIRLAIPQLVLAYGIYPDIWVEKLGFAFLMLQYVHSQGHIIVDKIKEGRAHTVASR